MPRKEASANPGCPMVYHLTMDEAVCKVYLWYTKVSKEKPPEIPTVLF